MSKTNLISQLSDKHSSSVKDPSRPGNAMAFAHYLGLPGRVTEAARAAPAKVKAVAAKLTRKPAASPAPAPRAATPAKVTPAATVAPLAAGASQIRQAITDERIRCAEIVAAGIKAGQTYQACSLAFDSNLSAAQAIATLKAGALDTAAHVPDSRRIRMGIDPADATAHAPQSRQSAREIADRIVAAGEKAAARGPASTAANTKADRIIAAGERARSE